MPEILIAEDERVVREGLGRLFGNEGFAVRLVASGEAAVQAFVERPAAVVLLDAMMDRGNGFMACGEIRRLDPFVPLLFYSALDAPDSTLRALELGADDYVLKTDPPAVLLARVRRSLRRQQQFMAARKSAETLRLGRLTVSLAELTLVDDRGGVEHLTRTEADLLKLLASERGRYFTTGEILTELRGENYVGDDNTVRVHIANLRRKLGPERGLIDSSRMRGYRLQ